MADVAEVGRPSVSIGTSTPSAEALLAASGPATPSIAPLPNSSGCLAQASGWLIIAQTKFEKMPFLAAINEAKFRTFVVPGTALLIEAKLIHEGSGFARTEVKMTAGGKPVCNAELTFRVVDFPDGEFIANMQDVAKRIELPLEAPAHG